MIKLKKFSTPYTYLMAYLNDNGTYHFVRYNHLDAALEDRNDDEIAPNFCYKVPINKANELKTRINALGKDDFMTNPDKWEEFKEWTRSNDIKMFSELDEVRCQKEFSTTDLPEVTFKTRNPELLTKIVTAIGELGNPGHTFTIVLDPGSESETKFTWDGDGSDYIELDSIKSFSEREQVPQYIADEVDASGVVVKYKGDWRIVSKKTTPYEFWDAKYKTKQDAEDALAAYHANK